MIARLQAMTCTATVLLLSAISAFSQEKLVDFDRIYPDEFHVQGFVLDKDQDIQIDAAGLYLSDGRDESLFVGYGWIIDAQTREVVWAFAPDEFSNDRPGTMQKSESVLLPKGSYEACYASYSHYERHGDWGYSSNDWNRGFVGRLLDRIFDRGDRFSYNSRHDLTREFFFTIRGSGKIIGLDELEKMHQSQRQQALLSLVTNHNDQFLRQGFSLQKATALDIYAIGEMREQESFDYSFIMNVDTREKVWLFNQKNSEPAGGASKNRMIRRTITLPAGKYVAVVTTDDSHSPQEWNAPPPHDPAYWGLSISAASPDQKQAFSLYDYQNEVSKNAIVAITQMRNSAFENKGFTLSRPVDVRIYAVGEGSDGEMYDYGWVVDATNHEKVWQMDYYETEHAGGGQKNRLVDSVIQLDKGSYIVYFITDDSHAYRHWNTAAPYDREQWGITITPVDPAKDSGAISDYLEENDPNILAKMVYMRDNERKSQRFTLNRETEIMIYALGEGSDGEMYDYGWIEDASGDVVWEMTYRQSDHAGGARKNRMQKDRIQLRPGSYRVYYESDGSHSFSDWNATPPHDPLSWGITVSKAK